MQRSAPSLASVLRNSKFCTGISNVDDIDEGSPNCDNFMVFAEYFGNCVAYVCTMIRAQ